ncbi:MAG: DsbA family protein [Microbacteriaceae bacterium]
MSKAAKINIAIVAGLVLLLGAVIAVIVSVSGANQQPTASGDLDPALIENADSHALTDPADAQVTVVEFLDFQCPGCGDLEPTMQELRADLGDEVRFVVRNFPLIDIHPNAVDAAVAAEAAADQDEYAAMHDALFANQDQWTGLDDATDYFRDLADELGLDLDAYDAAVADPATEERVMADRADALDLGLQGTPSIIVDGQLVQLQQLSDVRTAIEAALAE